MALSPEFFVTIAAVGVAAMGWASTEIRRWREDSSNRGSADATVTVEIAGFQKIMDAQAAALKALEDRQHSHELKDERFHATMEQIMKDSAANSSRLALSVENLTAQMSRLVPADVFVEAVPRNRRPPTR